MSGPTKPMTLASHTINSLVPSQLTPTRHDRPGRGIEFHNPKCQAPSLSVSILNLKGCLAKLEKDIEMDAMIQVGCQLELYLTGQLRLHDGRGGPRRRSCALPVVWPARGPLSESRRSPDTDSRATVVVIDTGTKNVPFLMPNLSLYFG